jgi:hypothetical protein
MILYILIHDIFPSNRSAPARAAFGIHPAAAIHTGAQTPVLRLQVMMVLMEVLQV